ncbi:hypothetical protein N7495_006028 [Penicillium taxi]|uniref:uncharacterized protein n=1 Tax=Penicillium taxi TaxID=168475 RepID=UPI00254573EA|nr:uncharacterized protein N7495_006028 [Penicillium taxi]KAJ5894337.1 hypothetical protein N7495_006028 [Penicillium taxi]
MPESDHDSVIPAQLSFLAIYNPTLGPTDETIEDQIVFYTSRSGHLQHTERSTTEEEGIKLQDEGRNERLRQVGLAQGIVNFSNNFSSGKPLEYVETDKTRVVLLELEKDWWVVASMDLTRLPVESTLSSSTGPSDAPKFQYSSREMGHPSLLIQQLRRANSIFLLLHDFSLTSLYSLVGRSSFCLFLERFWEKFAWNWEILLTGNPGVEIYNGIKLAAGGELGIGVGEEEWGSGEREVLEDFVARTDGVVDLIVSRFGDPTVQVTDSHIPRSDGDSSWLGLDIDPRPADGVVFSGVNAISRRSLVHLSHWMELIYRYGDTAYGVGRDPHSLRRRNPRRHRGRELSRSAKAAHPSTSERSFTPRIPRPLVMAVPESVPEAHASEPSKPTDQSSVFAAENVMKYLTLGYGTSWNLPLPGKPATPSTTAVDNVASASQESSSQSSESRNQTKTIGRFILGPRDDLDILDDLEERSPVSEPDSGKPKTRIIHRSVHVQLADTPSKRRLEAVIYVHQPFMFTFLFDPETTSLSSPSLYSSIHHQLGPLQKPLLRSTSPETVLSRFPAWESTFYPNKRFSGRSQPMYDLVYDPSNLTIRSSIPNIPALILLSKSPQLPNSPRSPSSSPSAPSTRPQWSRLESLAIHHRILSTYVDTRSRPHELERTCKTNRGWWILWVRIPQPPQTQALSTTSSSVADGEDPSQPPSSSSPPLLQPQEAFLVRRASDYVPTTGHARISSGGRLLRDLGGATYNFGSSRADITPSKFVDGLGLDPRRYVEGLLRLNR